MSHQLLSLIPMKSLTVWHGHSTRPSLPAGTARKASGRLSGRRPLHLANARPFGRLQAPLGHSLLRCAAQTRACLWQAEQAHHANNEKQEVPTGELPVVHIAIVCGFWQGASAGRTLFYLNLDKCIIILYRYFCSPFFSLCSSMYLFISAMSVWCFPLFTH